MGMTFTYAACPNPMKGVNMLDEQTSSTSPVEESGSDTAVSTDTGVTAESPAADTGVESAGSPPAESAAPKSLLDAVTTALANDKAAAEPKETPSVDDPGSGEPAANDAPAPADDDAKLPFGKHPRFRALIDERNALRGPAEQYGKIEAFMKQSNLTPNEVVEGFHVMALMRNDPEKAVSVLLNYARGIQEARGHVLPNDLHQSVQDGRVDERTAYELSRLRAAQREAQAREEAMQVAQQQQHVATVRNDVRDAVQQWETLTRQRDPDYAAKERMVHDRVKAIVMEDGKQPSNRDEAMALVARAYADVNSYARAFRPTQTPIRHVPSAHGSTASAPQPKSLRDAVRAALGT